MNDTTELGKFSLGMGDRFARQAKAQLRACIRAAAEGMDIVPVWNKSNREHLTVGSEPASVRWAADAAVKELGWNKPYHVDADHIRLDTVARFIPHSDFYTIDVADAIGQKAPCDSVKHFLDRHPKLSGRLEIPGIERPFELARPELERIAGMFLLAVQDAGRIYRRIKLEKGAGRFITEVSMDETSSPQTPLELLVILAALADENIPVQTIAPKFTGRFNKGVDYAGDVEQFEKEFNEDRAVISHAVKQFGLPENLKLSVHSGSDKFSIYPAMRRALRNGAGVHLKTAGTTWLEEIIGLAEAGGEGLALAKEVYGEALEHLEELSGPYAAVIDIDAEKLPPKAKVESWSSEQFVAALRHDPQCAEFNPHLRQLLHVGYKIAAKMGDRYLGMLERCHEVIGRNVTENLYERHIKPIFLK
jgi:tagaturonate epimerase